MSSGSAREPLLQSAWWGRVKAASGWTAIPRAAHEPLVLTRSIGPIRLAYAPHAGNGILSEAVQHAVESVEPGSATSGETSSALLQESLPTFVATLERVGRRGAQTPTLIRWDVPWESPLFPEATARGCGLTVAPVRVQPPDTVVLDLSAGSENLLAGMKSKTRYNVRLAEKKGVAVECFPMRAVVDDESALRQWYELYAETAIRDRITIHSFEYYQRVFTTAAVLREEGEAVPRISLYLATHEEDTLGGIVVASWDGESTYLYGASSNHKRNLMANYLLQWRAIEDAIRAGDDSYDFFGIPPTDDPGHPMHGLYRFKTGFGGRIFHRAGCWDLVVQPVRASLYRSAERLRQWYYHDMRKRSRR